MRRWIAERTLGVTCDASDLYELAADGSYAKGPLLNTYLTETWKRPNGCVARGLDGTPLVHGTDEQVLPTDDNKECIEAPLMGVQFWGGDPANAEFPGVEVNGNYGFGDGCFGTGGFNETTGACADGTEPTALPAGDYLVQVEIPNDARGLPLYKVTREEDINIGNGDEFVPAVPPSACVGALHTVDSTGNPTFPGGPGTSPYEGMQKPLCDTKLVTVNNGKSIAPAFNLYTDVPIPSRHWFIIIDDLNFSSNPKSVTYGEKAGMPFVPVGIYDYTDRLIKTVESDYNGLADVLLPSTNRINCPTPSGVCANLYRYVGNDPGVPGRLNPNYNPTYRTIAAEFETLPGLLVPADLAPTQVGVTVQLPGGQTTNPVMCALDTATPQLYAVSRPYVILNGGLSARQFTLYGTGFGSAAGTIRLGGAALPGSAITGWRNTQINVTLAQDFVQPNAAGPRQLTITAANGQSTVNGLTMHVISTENSSSYNPQRYEVGPGRTYAPAETLPAAADHAIQRALDDAATYVAGGNNRNALVVVYPNNPSANPRQNPRGAYYENLIITSRVKLQGVGPGSADGSVRGSIIDGGAFAGDSPVATDWYTTIGGITWAGNQTVYDGAVISVYVPSDTGGTTASRRKAFPTTYSAATAPSIDGFDLRGGDQQGFPGNINAIGGTPTGLPGGLITQGGAVFANAYARNLQITNNVVQNNGGAYGTIRIGTPDLPDADNHNEGVRIAYNRVIANAGTNQAGGIGIFDGADNYEVANNDICGNFSAEYGGGISVIGRQQNPVNAVVNNRIHDNRIYFNRSYDEGGGIMIAGALPATPTTLSPGSGPVNIYNNLIQANLANDDGGGLRFLMAGNFPMNVYNNFIVNNISTHEGGGIGINDAPNVRVFNNTIMKNLTTATAITSNGAAAPAGLSTSANSTLLQATLPGGVAGCGTGTNAPCFSNPLLFNNIFWDNRAGTRTGAAVIGLGAAGDATPINNWDLGNADNPANLLSPTNSVLQSPVGTIASPTNLVGVNPGVVETYDVGVTFNAWRNNPAFLGAIMISADLPPNLMGNYHLCGGTPLPPTCLGTSPAINVGASNKSGVIAPGNDIDGQARPSGGGYDIGADEVAQAAAVTANLSITKTDGVTSVTAGGPVSYTIVVANGGPSAVIGATVTDTFPGTLTVSSWTCTATSGSSCTANGTGNNRTGTVNLLNGGSATFTATTTLAASATGTLANTATVAAPLGTTDPNLANNSATDSDPILLPPSLPALGVLDNFNRGNSTGLGANWNTVGTIGVNGNQALSSGSLFGTLPATTYWGVPTTGFGATQGAAFTIANATLNGDSLILKASGTQVLGVFPNATRVQYNAGVVTVATTTTGGLSYTTRGTFSATFASGDVLTAVSNADGSVDVWRNTTYLGRSSAVTGTGFTAGRIGMQLSNGAQVDNFAGGTVP